MAIGSYISEPYPGRKPFQHEPEVRRRKDGRWNIWVWDATGASGFGYPSWVVQEVVASRLEGLRKIGVAK